MVQLSVSTISLSRKQFGIPHTRCVKYETHKGFTCGVGWQLKDDP